MGTLQEHAGDAQVPQWDKSRTFAGGLDGQNGFTITRITMPTISTAGTSLAIR